MSLNVCLLTSSHPVDYARFLHREGASLSRAGHEVSLLGLSSRPSRGSISGVATVGFVPRGRLGKLAVLRAIESEAIARHADVYHCVDPWTLALGMRIKRGRRAVRVVYDSTESFPDAYRQRGDLPWPVRVTASAVVRVLERFAIRSCDGIIETNATRAVRFRRMGRNVVLVPNYPPRQAAAAGVTLRHPWIAYTGLMSRPRGFDVLLRSLSILRDAHPAVRLKVAGEFDPSSDTERWARSYIDEHALQRHVELLGWQPYESMFDLLRQCAVGVILFQPGRWNDYTGLPNKLFDYMASGVAVVASDFPEMGRIVRETGCGWLVDPTSPDAVANALSQALSVPAACAVKGESGRLAVDSQYNWDSAEANLLGLYDRLR